jgi:hypothetical protein
VFSQGILGYTGILRGSVIPVYSLVRSTEWRNRMRILPGTIAVSLAWALLVTAACSESAHTRQVPTKTLELLEKKFMMSDVLAIVKTTSDLRGANRFFATDSKRFKHVGTQHQGEMRVEGYSVMDRSSPIVGYSLFFHKSSDSLAIVDTSVNPLNQEAVQNTTRLIKESFDSVAAGGDSKLYFLGIYNLDGTRLLKIMLREAKTALGPDYAIRYAISSK